MRSGEHAIDLDQARALRRDRQVRLALDQRAEALAPDGVAVDENDAEVAHLRTYSDGRTLFHAPLGADPDDQGRPSYRVMVAKGGYATSEDLPSGELEHTVVLDFNRMQNPPCAFTAFATCPLPPKENRLPFRVPAGEKKYRGEN